MIESLYAMLTSSWFWISILIAAFLFGSNSENSGKFAQTFKAAITKTAIALVIAWKHVLLSLPGLEACIRRRVDAFTDERVQALFDKRFYNLKNLKPSDLMLRGSWADRLNVARAKYPRKEYPSLWIKDTPDDLRRSLIQDGAPITKDSLSYVAESFVTTAHQGVAFRSGLMCAILWFSLLVVAWHPTVFLSGARAHMQSNEPTLSAAVLSSDERLGLALGEDHWDEAKFLAALAERRSQPTGAAAAAASVEEQLLFSFLDPTRLLFPVSLSLLLGWSAFRGAIRAALSKVSAGLHDNTREIVRNKDRIGQRRIEYMTYCEQLKQATTYDKSDYLINFGVATGEYRLRGRLDAPYAGQAMSLDKNALHMSTIVFGGTGGGKTRGVILPVLSQVLDMRTMEQGKAQRMRETRGMSRALPPVASRGMQAVEFQWPFGIAPDLDAYEKIKYPMNVSVYLTDGKAVLYSDLMKMAAQKGLLHDVMVIGPNAAQGEYSVDLLDGVDPQLFSDMIKSVARQAGGEKGGEMWPDMAADVLRNCAVIARMFDLTPAGLTWIKRYRERPYSLVFIYKLAMDSGALLQMCLDAIDEYSATAKGYATLSPYWTPEFVEAALYLSKEWLPMVDATRMGIKVNITNVMGPFASNQPLRGSFACGGGDRPAAVYEFWGKLVVTNISTVIYGTAGRIINIFMKTLFQTEAARRQKENTDQLSALNAEFFDKYPQFCNTRKPFKAIAASHGLMSQEILADFKRWDDALSSAHQRADDLILQSGLVDDIALTNDSMLDLERKVNVLAGAKLLDNEAKDVFQKASDEEESFRIKNPSMAFERNTPMENRDFDPTQLNGDQEGLLLYYKIEALSSKMLREVMFFIADEFQTLITVDAKDAALSDSSFWNMSRSMGIAAFMATQTYASLKQAIGQEALDNFLPQIRNKIFLQVEDPAVLEYVKKLSGKTLRAYSYKKDSYESYDAMIAETGMNDPFLHGPVPIGIEDADSASADSLACAVEGAFKPGSLVSSNDAIKNLDQTTRIDRRFVTPQRRWGNYKTGVQNNNDSRLASEQQAAWRQEDLDHKRLSEGLREADVATDQDMMSLGRNHAIAFLIRAGKTRMDIIQISQVIVNED